MTYGFVENETDKKMYYLKDQFNTVAAVANDSGVSP